MEIDWKHKESNKKKVLEFMTEEQLESMFGLMQVMFVESFFGIDAPVEESTEDKNQEDADEVISFSQERKEKKAS